MSSEHTDEGYEKIYTFKCKRLVDVFSRRIMYIELLIIQTSMYTYQFKMNYTVYGSIYTIKKKSS
jgi:hypothetical protein